MAPAPQMASDKNNLLIFMAGTLLGAHLNAESLAIDVTNEGHHELIPVW
ncbi:MAG: hypothetical protein Aurels2KO_16770 [Aureliella sp.]